MINKITWSSVEKTNKQFVYVKEFNVTFRVSYKMFNENNENFIFIKGEEMLTTDHPIEKYGEVQCSVTVKHELHSSDEILAVISKVIALVLSGKTDNAKECKIEEKDENAILKEKLRILKETFKDETFRKNINKKTCDALAKIRLSEGYEVYLESLGMCYYDATKDCLEVLIKIAHIKAPIYYKSLESVANVSLEKIDILNQETIIDAIVENVIEHFIYQYGDELLTPGV